MELKPAACHPEDWLFRRRVSETGLVELGIHPVAYGFRVRAGFVGSLTVELDWCGGADFEHVTLLYSIAAAILTRRPENPECFDGLPGHSQVKPFLRDPEFTEQILAAAGWPVPLIDLGHPWELLHAIASRDFTDQ